MWADSFKPTLPFVLGLIDGDEDAETAAMRELEEETGFKGTRIIESSPLQVSDPGSCSHMNRSTTV